jgi:hypothetical protein
MRRRSTDRGSVLAALLPRVVIAAGVVGGVLLQAPLGKSNADRRRNDFRYTPDVDVVRVLSFGHRSTMADAIWLRALPDFSRQFDDLALKERWLNGVFDVATDLDPTFYTAYAYGSTYLSLINRQADSAIALLERGVDTFERIEAEDGRLYAGGTRLRIDLAMAYYMFKKDRAKALEHLDIAVERPDCDWLTRGMRVGLALNDRDDLLALTFSAQNIEHQNVYVREKATLDFERTKRSIARRCHREFVAREGRPPESIEELRAKSEIEPAAAEVVFPAVVYDDEGVIQAPKLAELELRELIRAIEGAADTYRRDYGDWPAPEWFFDRENNQLLVIDADDVPEGTRLEIDDDGSVRFAPIDGDTD